MEFEAQFISEPTGRLPTCHAANLAVLADGTLAFVCFRGSREGAEDSVTVMQTLQPNGSWSEVRVVVDEPHHSAGNSVLMPIPDGRVILFYTLSYATTSVWAHSLVHYQFSADNGRTWGPRHTLTEELGYICRNPGLILSNGEWLLPIYDNRRGGKPEYAGMGGNEGSVGISDDGGLHWRRYGRMVADAGTAQPTVVQLEPGHLRAFLRTRSPLNIALSYDDGETWPVRRELEPYSPEEYEFSYPAVAQTPDGTIHVAYTYRRTHMKHVALDQQWIDHGA